jgi:hypothetical protein
MPVRPASKVQPAIEVLKPDVDRDIDEDIETAYRLNSILMDPDASVDAIEDARALLYPILRDYQESVALKSAKPGEPHMHAIGEKAADLLARTLHNSRVAFLSAKANELRNRADGSSNPQIQKTLDVIEARLRWEGVTEIARK